MRTYKITEKQLEKLKTITEKLKIDGLKAAIKSADEMSTYLEMHAETPEEKGLYESYLETWDNSHMQLEDIAENARELKYIVEDIEEQPVEARKEKTFLEVIGAEIVEDEGTCPSDIKYSNAFRTAGYKQPDPKCPRDADDHVIGCVECWERPAEPLEDADHARA